MVIRRHDRAAADDPVGRGVRPAAAVGRNRNGRIEIRIPINETTDVPFYREMAQWEGKVARGRRLAGGWRCGPQINEGGYVDLDLTAEGTWRLEPQH